MSRKHLPIRRACTRIVVVAAVLAWPIVACAAESQILLPLGRTAYFVGDQIVLANPDTRPTSFNPVDNDPREFDGLSQRMMLMAQANFDRDYEAITRQADQIINGYCSTGMDNTIGYPGWMLGYWHGIIVAGGVDNLCGTPFCTSI